MKRIETLGGATAVALVLAAMSGEAFAQSAGGGVEEVVVTARKREERLQAVPASITALTAETITRTGSTNLSDLARVTPGLTLYEGTAGGLSAPVLRGIANTVTTTFDNNVGIFLDGVYLSAKSNLDINFFNLQRVEVIRGPQTALYGANSFSGAINYILRRPSNDFTSRVQVTAGTDKRIDGAVLVSGPIIKDVLAGQIVASASTFDGTIDNNLGENVGGWDYKRSISGSLLFTPNEKFEASLFLYHSEDKLDGGANNIYLNNCGGINDRPPLTGRGGTIFRYRCGTLKAPAAVDVSPFSYSTRGSDIAIAKLSYDFGPVTLKSTTSSGSYDVFALQDAQTATTTIFTATYAQPFVGPVDEISQELRLESYGNRVLDGAVGYYYYERDANQTAITGVGPSQTARSLDQTTLDRTEVNAVFALANWHVTPQFDVEGQIRYTKEDKSAQLLNNLTKLLRNPAKTFRKTTYKLTGTYRWTPNRLLYASIATGTKSGGFNNTAVPSEQAFGPEENTTYEAGVKNTLFDGRLVLNASVYYVDWKDLQLPVPSAIAGTTNYTSNAGAVEAPGFEIEFAANPISAWRISGGYAYTSPEWVDGTIDISSSRNCATAAACGLSPGPGGVGIDISGRLIPRAARHTANLSSTYTVPTSAGDVYFRGDVSYRSPITPSAAIALQNTGDQTLTNFRVGLVREKFEFSGWVNNAFDKNYVVSGVNQPEFVPQSTYTTGFVANGRTAGVTLEYSF